MVDENKSRKIIHTTILIGAIIIAIVIAIAVIYNMTKTKNTNNFYNYLKDNGYKDNKDGTYTKTVTTGNKTIEYLYSDSDFILSKEIRDGNLNISLIYQNDNTIESTLEYSGLTNDNEYGTTLQSGTYKVNKEKFECEILIDDGFGSKCKQLKEEVEKFEIEVEDILSQSDSKIKYIEKK